MAHRRLDFRAASSRAHGSPALNWIQKRYDDDFMRRRRPLEGPGVMPDQVERPQRAAEYVRMSTEHQQYSTENQTAVHRRYAEAHKMEIVRTYADDGKTGLNIEARNALQQLIADVESGIANFEAILVYDVSRWGRFQDTDQSAYYEYLCRRANIGVHYCAEPFVNDGSLNSTLLKAMKRSMAAEYSRELSVKVFAGQCRLIELGFRQGGPPGYGLRRLLIDQQRNPKGLLKRGERKSIQTDRVILVPGPKEEVSVVQEIYRRFVEDGQLEGEITEILNGRGLLTDWGRLLTRAAVRQILTNPKYIGANVYNRRSFKLKEKRVVNPPEMWISRDQAFEPIIAVDMFRRAQEIFATRLKRYSDDEMLELLRRLLARKGSLSGIIIDEAEDMPSSAAYRARFKSLFRAYQLIGYTPQRDHTYLEINKILREHYRSEVAAIVEGLQAVGATVSDDPGNDLFTVNEEFTVSVVPARCRSVRGSNSFRWLIRLDTSLMPDITVVARMQPDNQAVLDYYLLPNIDDLAERIRLAPENGFVLDVYRFENLSFLFRLARRQLVEEVA
jgi:DNA invertase Pin-like site-specific DNA recombinase